MPRPERGKRQPLLPPGGTPLLHGLPNGMYFGLPGIAFDRLDYESAGKSAKVVDTPEGAKQNPAGGNRVRKDLISWR
ncbi:hypothetical protein, partial [Streptomyces sp. ICBB 8177]|uniref:hypothetical protein n=1 Tax=Streptomyces sp. ICBB 8177 TaxID=563922 RepID=UPI001A7E16ED